MSLHRDTPPGHRRFKFGSWFDGNVVPWLGEPGDCVLQIGKRMGRRLWLVTDVEPLQKWATVLLAPVLYDEFVVALEDAEGRGWLLTPKTIEPITDLTVRLAIAERGMRSGLHVYDAVMYPNLTR